VDGAEDGVGRSQIGVGLILAIAIFAEQIHVRRDRHRQARDGLPLEGAVAAAEDVEVGAGGAQRAAIAADAQTATDRELHRVSDGEIVHQVDHVRRDLVAAGGSVGTRTVQADVVLCEGKLVFETKAAFKGIAHRNGADGIIAGADLGVQQARRRDRGDAIACLAVPTTAKTQIPAFCGHRRRTESRGGDSRHGDQTKLHFSNPRSKYRRAGNPPPISSGTNAAVITAIKLNVSIAYAALRQISDRIPRFYRPPVSRAQQHKTLLIPTYV